MAKGRINKYKVGSRIHIGIPSYVDEVTLNWINSRSSLQPSIWDVIKKEAYREYRDNSSSFNEMYMHHENIAQNIEVHQPYKNIANEISNTKMNSNNVMPNKETSTEEVGITVDELSYEENINTNIVTNNNQKVEIKSETIKSKIEKSNTNVDSSVVKEIKTKVDKENEKTNGLDLNSAFKKKKKVKTLQGDSPDRVAFKPSKPNKLAEDILSK